MNLSDKTLEKAKDIDRGDLKTLLFSDEMKVFVVFFLIFGLFANWGGSNADSRYDLTKAMVEDRSFEITEYAHNTNDKAILIEPLWDEINRTRYENAANVERERIFREAIDRTPEDEMRVYSDKAPMSSILAIPGYIAGDLLTGGTGEHVKKLLITLSTSALFGAALLAALFNHLKDKFGRRTGIYTAIIAGAATPLLTYSASFFGVINAAFFAFCSFIALEKFRNKGETRMLYLSGLLAAFAYSTEYYVGLIVPIFMAYLYIREEEGLGRFVGGMIAGSLPMFLYHWSVTGNPLLPVQFAFNTYFYQPGPINEVCAVYASCDTSTFFGFLLSPVRFLNTFFRLLFFETRGLFFYSPVLLLSLPGIYHIYRSDRKLLLVAPGVCLALLIFQSLYMNWLAGVSFGPRYVVPAIPFLMIPVAYTIDRLTGGESGEEE